MGGMPRVIVQLFCLVMARSNLIRQFVEAHPRWHSVCLHARDDEFTADLPVGHYLNSVPAMVYVYAY